MNLVYEGRCWKLDADVSSDELISARHVFEYDPQQLRKHLLAELRPAFAQEAKEGDLIVAGKRFAHGSQHTHPFLAMKAMGLGLVAHRLLRPPFRLAIYCGVPLLEIGDEALTMFDDGDRMRVDFETGQISNLSRNRQVEVAPLPAFLLQIVQAGGGLGYLSTSHTRSASMEASHDS
ncbi:3-isopropylmalate dehydratase [Paralcaligenes sp. KSB-10]|uniref:3-isopropylmalate dehydratase n=1 Tax=Paralcaligenes sp. KSB-10 TaxID=2901142 RepID=UPI001E413900|nr:3-isopropylmalate dehydratase [Paralcaligenes sp. KSB-10]UHL64051.1 3-isopropylmalate dehydratase [Paralcaligenes sp. KSB-10]